LAFGNASESCHWSSLYSLEGRCRLQQITIVYDWYDLISRLTQRPSQVIQRPQPTMYNLFKNAWYPRDN
jgi:hypothetical protein